MSDKPPTNPSGTIRLKSVESKGIPVLSSNTAKKPAALLNRTPALTRITSTSTSTSTPSTASNYAAPSSTFTYSQPEATTTTTTTSSSGSTSRSVNVSLTSGVTKSTPAVPKPVRAPITPNLVPRAKKEFTPNLVPRKKVEDSKLDSMLPGTITDLLKDSLTPIGTISDQKPKHQDRTRQIRSGINPRAKKHGTSAPLPNAPSLPLSQLPESYLEKNNQQRSANREADRLNEDFVNQLFHEMEIDPMQPNHPTHLPLVDPRKVMKEYSLKDAKQDVEKKKKEIQEKIQNGEMSDGMSLDSLIEDTNNTLFSKPKKVEEQVKPFHNDGIFFNDDHLFFIQLPTSLPSSATRPVMMSPLMPLPPGAKLPPGAPGAKPAATPTPQPTPAATSTDSTNPPELNKSSFIPMIYPGDFSNTMKSLPSGRLGSLKIYKSGKTILTIGSVDYYVSAGNKLKFLEEIKCITHEGPTCYTLGTPSQHLVASPIIGDIGAPST